MTLVFILVALVKTLGGFLWPGFPAGFGTSIEIPSSLDVLFFPSLFVRFPFLSYLFFLLIEQYDFCLFESEKFSA